jgi:hypothetical protein
LVITETDGVHPQNPEKGRHRSLNRWWSNPPAFGPGFILPTGYTPKTWKKAVIVCLLSTPESVVAKSTSVQIRFPPPQSAPGESSSLDRSRRGLTTITSCTHVYIHPHTQYTYVGMSRTDCRCRYRWKPFYL